MNWVDIAPSAALPVDRGVAALVGDHPIAVFRLADGEIFAIDHIDPTTAAPVLARGLVGSVDERPVVSSPLHRARFCLRTGQCLDRPSLAVAVWPVTVVDGWVRVGAGRWIESCASRADGDDPLFPAVA